MYEAEVARIWDRVEYFQAKQAPESVAIYCNQLINKVPDTVYAERSRAILEAQARSEGRRLSLPRMPGRNRQSQPEDPTEAEPEIAEKKLPLRFPKLWWPARPVPKDEAPPAEATEAFEETEEMPVEEEATEEEAVEDRPSTGRATLE